MRIIAIIYFAIFTFQDGSAQQVDVSQLYNDATRAVASDDMATAIYNLELAAMLKPYDGEIYNNLRIAKTKVDVDVVEIEQFFLARWLDDAAGILLPGSWKYLTILSLVLLILQVYQRSLKKNDALWCAKGSIISMAIFCVILITLGSHRSAKLHNGKFAIVFGETTSLKQGPDEVSKDIKDISKGVKLEILDRSGAWYKVSAMDREQGWIPQSEVRILKI